MKSIHLSLSKSEEAIITTRENIFCEHLHYHEEFQISCLINCHGDFIVEDYKGKFESGDVFLVGSNQVHLFKEDGSDKIKDSKQKFFSVFVDTKLVEQYFSNLLEFQFVLKALKKFSKGAKVLDTDRSEIADLILATINSSPNERLINFLKLMQRVAAIKSFQSFNWSDSVSLKVGYDSQRLDKVIAFTKDNLNRSIRLEEAAEVAFLTPESFCKYFKNRTGKTYIQFLNEMRVHTASKFLIQESLNLNEICSKVGFSNMSYFNRIFKRIKGTTPKEFQINLQ